MAESQSGFWEEVEKLKNKILMRRGRPGVDLTNTTLGELEEAHKRAGLVVTDSKIKDGKRIAQVDQEVVS